jgi:ferrous iron transport protein A
MNNNDIPLSALPLGKKCKVTKIVSEGLMRRRMLDLGIIDGTVVEALQRSPSGGLVAYFIRGAVIALRSEVAAMILIETL